MRRKSRGGEEEFVSAAKGAESSESETMNCPYPARLTETNNRRVRAFLEQHGRSGESINSILNQALERELDRREEEIGNQERLLRKAERLEAEERAGEGETKKA